MSADKHIVITTNIYRRAGKDKKAFDHPGGNNNLYKEINSKLVESIRKQQIPKEYKVSWHILVTQHSPLAANSVDQIKQHVRKASKKTQIKIFSFENVEKIHQINPSLFNLEEYSAVRNTAFALAYQDKADIVIQIDSDEELQKNYLTTVVKTLEDNPKIQALGGFYLEEGRRVSPLQDPLESWPKYSAMNVDATEITANDKVSPSYFAKGGNLIVTKRFIQKMCFPTAIPRGEDFAMILRSWLTYYNGNKKAGIHPKDPTFKFFVNPSRDMAIIHHTHHAAIKNFLSYLEKNLERFAIETNTVRNQRGLSSSQLRSDSTYIGKVIFIPNFPTVVNTIYGELTKKAARGTSMTTNPIVVSLRASSDSQETGPTYTKAQIENSRTKLLAHWEKIKEKNYWKEFQKEQATYVKQIAKVKNLLLSSL